MTRDVLPEFRVYDSEMGDGGDEDAAGALSRAYGEGDARENKRVV